MRMSVRRPFSLFLFLVVTVTLGVITGVVLAASSGDGQPKRHGATIASQPQGQPDPDLLPLWAAFLGTVSGPVSVTWSHLWGTPTAIYGTLSDTMAVSESSARQFLSTHAALLKLEPSLSGVTLAGSKATPMGQVYEFSQAADGVPVYGAELKVHFNREGRVVGLTNSSVPSAKLGSMSPSVGAEQAVESARGHVPPAPVDEPESGDLPLPSTKLVIYAETGTPTLAWEVILYTPGPTWQVFVHAKTRDVLAPARDLNRYATGTGQVFLVNAVVATRDNTLRDNNDAASAVPPSAYRSVSLLGLDGTGFLDGSYASSSATKRRVSSASETFVFDRSNNGFSETMGYYFLDYAQRYIQSLGFSSVNNRQQIFSVDRLKKDNSSYDPSKKTITYGTGGVDDAEDAEVIWHEYGHSIQDNQVPGFGTSLEAGSMGEGFGDYWAGSVGAQLSGGFQDLCIADWDATSYSTTSPPCLRRLDSTKHYPEDIVGEVHDDGEIWSAALWQIRTAIGAGKTDTVVLQHHFLLTADTSFNQAANALVTAATNLHYTAKEISAIRSILQNRGFTVTVS
ncbi:MAG TPA: M36 family metallopeptidase [Nitrospira sp.]|nr:M36 family metallopeptidase [Nitrospira sp.]